MLKKTFYFQLIRTAPTNLHNLLRLLLMFPLTGMRYRYKSPKHFILVIYGTNKLPNILLNFVSHQKQMI